jgi:hypothetical protein
MKYISLGYSCQPAYHIRRITGDESANFFDWLITPTSALQLFLENFQEHLFLNSGDYPLCNNDGGVLDQYSGIEFLHDFPRADNKILISEIPAALPSVREKYLFLRKRFQDVVASGPCIFFCYLGDSIIDEMCHKMLININKLIADFSSHSNILCVCGSNIPTDMVGPNENIFFYQMEKYTGPPEHAWRGDDIVWNDIFNKLNSYYQVYYHLL